MGRKENLEKKIYRGSLEKENKHSYSYTWARAWFELQKIISLFVTRVVKIPTDFRARGCRPTCCLRSPCPWSWGRGSPGHRTPHSSSHSRYLPSNWNWPARSDRFLFPPVFRIRDILVRIRNPIRILGSIPLTNGSASCSFCQWPSRCQ